MFRVGGNAVVRVGGNAACPAADGGNAACPAADGGSAGYPEVASEYSLWVGWFCVGRFCSLSFVSSLSLVLRRMISFSFWDADADADGAVGATRRCPFLGAPLAFGDPPQAFFAAVGRPALAC